MKKKIIVGVVSVLVLLLIILMVLPFDMFENLGKDKNKGGTEVVVQPDNSGDLESINDKINKDNEELGDSGEEITTEESTEPYEVESYDKIDSIYAYVPNTYVEVYNVEDLDLDISDLDFSYNPNFERLGATTGKNASIDLIKSILVEENLGYFIEVVDMVYVKKLDDNTVLCKISESNDDLLIIHNCGDIADDLIFLEEGRVCSYSFVIDNLSVQEIDGREVIVYVYNYDETIRR